MIDLQTRQIVTREGKSSVVIISHLGGIPGGVALDTSLTPGLPVLRAGHLIVSDGTKYYAAPVSGSAYADLGGKTPVGVLTSDTIPATNLAPVTTIGQVNAKCAPYPYTDAIKKALPRIEFL